MPTECVKLLWAPACLRGYKDQTGRQTSPADQASGKVVGKRGVDNPAGERDRGKSHSFWWGTLRIGLSTIGGSIISPPWGPGCQEHLRGEVSLVIWSMEAEKVGCMISDCSRASLPGATQQGYDLGLQCLSGTQYLVTGILGFSGHLSACFLAVLTHPWRGEEGRKY